MLMAVDDSVGGHSFRQKTNCPTGLIHAKGSWERSWQWIYTPGQLTNGTVGGEAHSMESSVSFLGSWRMRPQLTAASLPARVNKLGLAGLAFAL